MYSLFNSCGHTMGFLIGAVLTVKAQLWFLLSVIILAALCDLVLEFMLHRKVLNVNEGHGTHADCNSGPPQNQLAGVNALFAMYRNRRPSALWIREDNTESQDVCRSRSSVPFSSSRMAGSTTIVQPCFIEEEEISITPA